MSLHHALLAKEYLERASSDIRSQAPFAAGFAVSALQDAVEMMLFAAAVEVGATPRDFEGTWSAVDARLPNESRLPYRAQLMALNKARVQFKHYGTLPDLDEVGRFRAGTDAFLGEVCSNVLRRDFSAISQIDLLSLEPVKGYLLSAQEALKVGDIDAALKRCTDAREAIREREWPLYSHGITVQFNNVPKEVRSEIDLQVGNLRTRVNQIADVALGALFGLNLVDLRILESLLPTKKGGEYEFDQAKPFPTLHKNVARCIQVLTRYAISVEKYWSPGTHPDWMPV